MDTATLSLVGELRARGMAWAQIAAQLRVESNRGPLAAMRVAHGWTQQTAAEEWNKHWPEDKKTFKNFSYWENWPGDSGYPPHLPTLLRLAELYQCAMSDLTEGLGDFRHLDEALSSLPNGVCRACGTPIASVECPPVSSMPSTATPRNN